MRTRIIRRRRPLALAVLLLTSVAVAATVLLLGGGTAAAFETGVDCSIKTGPAPSSAQAPIRTQLNTVVLNPSATDPLVKTVAMEKDIYTCQESATGTIIGTRDLETFIEIVERTATPSTPTIVPVSKRVEVVACDKRFRSTALGTQGVKCTTSTVPLGRALSNPFDGCLFNVAIGDPNIPPETQMNTVAVGNNQVKTIKVDKEIFTCTLTDETRQFRDVYLFTEILERLNSTQSDITPYKKFVDGIVCARENDTAAIPAPTILSCNPITIS